MDLFDIIGPVMVGPSSSHTAGAARIGKITRMLLGSRPVSARIGLYGSFQKTYLGHGTDKALIGGLLGMNVDDSRLRDSLRLSLDGVPEGIRLEEVERTIASVEGVRGVHHIHIWAISTTENALTAHVVLEPEAEARMEQVKHQVKERLHEAGIGHATLEFETAGEHCCEPYDL